MNDDLKGTFFFPFIILNVKYPIIDEVNNFIWNMECHYGIWNVICNSFENNFTIFE